MLRLTRLGARALSSSSSRTAKLLNSAISAEPSFAQTPPPLAPAPHPEPSPSLPRLPPIAAGTPHDFDDFLIRTLASTHFQSAAPFPALPTLLRTLNDNSGVVLRETLKNEPAPKPIAGHAWSKVEGDLNTNAYQSGLVVVAHVIARGAGSEPQVFVSSGFVVGEDGPGVDTKIVTCCHDLQRAAKAIARTTSAAEPASASFVLASSGHLFPVTSVLSSMPSVDICILSIAPEPIRNPLRNSNSRPSSSSPSPLAASHDVPRLQSLPVTAFPAVAGTRIAALRYNDPATPPSARWMYGRVAEYSDFAGRLAETGTYDDLSAMHISPIPNPGASGGPIIDVESGAVVGVIRGSSSRYGDKGARGLCAPAEKLFELFQLPGFVQKSGEERESKVVQDEEEDFKGKRG